MSDANRKAFETWAKSENYGTARSVTTMLYDERDTRIAWQVWQAASPVSTGANAKDAAPPGYVLVPLEPTPEMIAAAFAGKVEDQSLLNQIRRREQMAANYRAMIAAAMSDEAGKV